MRLALDCMAFLIGQFRFLLALATDMELALSHAPSDDGTSQVG
jgi:hypothetical protein